MDGLSFWQVLQWILMSVLVLALFIYLYFGMDSLRKWYFIHDISKYVTFATFVFFFSPLLFAVSGSLTSTSAETSVSSASCNSLLAYRTANVSDAMHWIHGSSISTVPGCQVPILLYTDLVVATITGCFVFYVLLDPYLHSVIHKQATENKNSKNPERIL